MRMKNFIFKSSLDKDLLKIFSQLDAIQKELRANRYDNKLENQKLDTCVKALAAIYSTPKDMTEETIEKWPED